MDDDNVGVSGDFVYSAGKFTVGISADDDGRFSWRLSDTTLGDGDEGIVVSDGTFESPTVCIRSAARVITSFADGMSETERYGGAVNDLTLLVLALDAYADGVTPTHERD